MDWKLRDAGTHEPGSLVTIACDESASEGENLMRARHPVFVHASVNVSFQDAQRYMDQIRAVSGSRAREVKSTVLLEASNRSALLDMLGSMEARVNICLVEKSYYICCKLVDLLIAAKAGEQGENIGLSGLGRQYATVLHDLAPQDVGPALFRQVLIAFNDFIRVYARGNATPPSSDPFFTALEDARERTTNDQVGSILQSLWDARHFALEYEGRRLEAMREMDPMFSTLNSVAMAWRIRLGRVPLEFLVDEYSTLTPHMREMIIAATKISVSVAGQRRPQADLRAIRSVDSKHDPRIQLADIMAGVGREVANLAQHGTFDDALQIATSEMLDANRMWSDGSYLEELSERRPLRYVAAYLRSGDLA
jgi:hypothetical protein